MWAIALTPLALGALTFGVVYRVDEGTLKGFGRNYGLFVLELIGVFAAVGVVLAVLGFLLR